MTAGNWRKSMGKKSDATPKNARSTLRELHEQLATAVAENAASRPRLRRLLLDGKDTSALRTEVRALGHRIAEMNTIASEMEAESEREAASNIHRNAAALVNSIVSAIAARLAALQPPAHPENGVHK
jgi:ABC-type transporter Mla subunit MlaD